jgi:hypothetical protein
MQKREKRTGNIFENITEKLFNSGKGLRSPKPGNSMDTK